MPSDPTGTRTRTDGTRNPGDRHVKFNTAYDGDDLREKDRRHTVHGWTDYSQFLQDGPEILVEGDGVYVTDLYGNRLMDAMAGVWCVNVGYGRTEIVDAIAAQARRLPFANPFRATSSPPAAELSAKLAELANIEILEREGICRHVREMSAHFKESLETLLDFDIVGDVRGAGFMFAIENVADKETRSLFPPEVEIGHRIACHARRLGLIVRPGGHLNIFSPPLTMTRTDVEFLTDTLRRSVRSTLDNLIREGLWRG